MTQSDRHITLDAIRGFAVMGILLLNIVGFSMPDAAYVNPAAWGGTDPLNAGVWAVNFVLFDGKMRGLFSVLFGASMLLVMQRAEAAGQNPRSVHLNRMAWLFVIGTAHFILLWWGDILVPYAICGTLALFFVNKDVKQLLRWAIILYVLYFLLSLVMAGGGWGAGDAGSRTGCGCPNWSRPRKRCWQASASPAPSRSPRAWTSIAAAG
jgi:uncharacterized protein